MTEYDYSPEAFERHIRKQQTIAKWVQNTKQGPMRDPYTPATPAVNSHALENGWDDPSDQNDTRRHRRGQSYDRHNDHRDRDLNKHGDRDRDKDKPRSLHHSSRPPNTRRPRSASQSQSVPRSYTVPPPLPLPPHPWQMPHSQKPSPVASIPPAPYPQYLPKLTSPRDSRRSSHSSSTTRIHSPNSYFPPQTSPYGSSKHSPDTNYGYTQPVPLRDGRIPDFTNAPQYPHSAYQVKQPPTLFKRLLKGLTGGNKQASEPQRVPRRKRSSSL